MFSARLRQGFRSHGQNFLRAGLYLRSKGHFLSPQCYAVKLRRVATISAPPKVEIIDPSYFVEEEIRSTYNPLNYYPVKTGQVFQERYEVIGKLGFGTQSTVWLCRDLRKEHDYVALKVYVNNLQWEREAMIYEENINRVQTTHPGRTFVREMYDWFDIRGPHGVHVCLVHQPTGRTFEDLRDDLPDKLFNTSFVRSSMQLVLLGLQFLHEEAKVIHTDLQPSNILLGIKDTTVLAEYEDYETRHPCPRKELEDRTVYMSRPMPLSIGVPLIADLGEARFGHHIHTDKIMPIPFRAPEVILGMTWSYPVDIWGFGMTLWDLFQPRKIFRLYTGEYSEAKHLAEMIALLGPPPPKFLQKCRDKADKYWEKDGTWKNLAPIPNLTLESVETRFEGDEKQAFLAFMRKMLQWDPEDRYDAESLYEDDWFQMKGSATAAKSPASAGDAPELS